MLATDAKINVKLREGNTLAVPISTLQKVQSDQIARGWFRNFVLQDTCGDCVREARNGIRVLENISVWKDQICRVTLILRCLVSCRI